MSWRNKLLLNYLHWQEIELMTAGSDARYRRWLHRKATRYELAEMFTMKQLDDGE